MLGYGIPTITTHLSSHAHRGEKETFSIIYFIQDTTAGRPCAHELHTPAQVIGEIDALAHLPSDHREQQRSCKPAAVQSTPLTRDMRVSLIMNVLSRGLMSEQ